MISPSLCFPFFIYTPLLLSICPFSVSPLPLCQLSLPTLFTILSGDTLSLPYSCVPNLSFLPSSLIPTLFSAPSFLLPSVTSATFSAPSQVAPMALSLSNFAPMPFSAPLSYMSAFFYPFFWPHLPPVSLPLSSPPFSTPLYPFCASAPPPCLCPLSLCPSLSLLLSTSL